MSEVAPLVASTAQIFVSLIFLAAALHKLRDPQRFVASLRDYRVLPATGVPAAAAIVGITEAAIVVGVWLPTLRAMAGAAAAGLLVVYGAAIAINLARGRREIDCGCTWARDGQPISLALVLRNAVLVLPCAWLAIGPGPSSQSLAAAAVALAAGVVLFVSLRTFETLAAHAPALRRLAD